MNALRLVPELVPEAQWGANLRSALPKREWDQLRRACYDRAGHRCEVCGGAGRRHAVEAHERWSYDEATGTQRLDGLIALCPECHACKHIGRTLVTRDARGFERAMRHLARVNGIDLGVAVVLVERVFAEYAHRERAGVRWTLDLSWLQRKEG